MGVHCFQLFYVCNIGSNLKIVSHIWFDCKGRARATRMNRCQLELHHLSVYNLMAVDAMHRQLRRCALCIQLVSYLDEIQEWLQAESQSAKDLSDCSLECNSTSVIYRSPLTSTTEGMPELSATWLFIFVAPKQVEVSGCFLFGVSNFFGKSRSAPWRNVLWGLSQSSLVYLRGWGHCLNE